MKILFINTGPWGTGSFTLIQCVARGLIKLGHEVKIFFPDANFESVDRDEYYQHPELYHIWNFPIQSGAVELRTFPLMITDPHPRNPNSIIFKDLSEQQLEVYEKILQMELSTLIESFEPDIIECHHIWYPCSLLERMGKPYIVTAHHSDQLAFRYDKRARHKATNAARGAQKIIAISESVKREVMRLYHVDESKVDVISNAYNDDIFTPTKVNKQAIMNLLGVDIPENAHIINFAGKLSRTKGIDILLQANKLLDPEMNIHILIMGSGDLQSILENLDPTSYDLKNLHFLGHQTPQNVANIHHISSLSVMPSRSEGFGIACLEAMGCGLPMIVTRCGGPEQFAVGHVIDIGSPEQLADGIMKLLKLPEEDYQKLRMQASLTAQRYSSRAITLQHLALFSDLLF